MMETSLYQLFKLHLMHFLPLSKDAIHIYLGLSIYFAAALFFRHFASWKPVLVVLAISVIMECFDLRDDFSSYGYFRWGASLHDIVNTIFWPVTASLLLRVRAGRHAQAKKR